MRTVQYFGPSLAAVGVASSLLAIGGLLKPFAHHSAAAIDCIPLLSAVYFAMAVSAEQLQVIPVKSYLRVVYVLGVYVLLVVNDYTGHD